MGPRSAAKVGNGQGGQRLGGQRLGGQRLGGQRLDAACPTMEAMRRPERKVITVLFADIKGSLALAVGNCCV